MERASERETVLLTGITGFIGAHVAQQLLQQHSDKYHIRATVRSVQNAAKLQSLRDAFGDELYEKVEFLEADLLNKEALFKAIEGVQHVIHLANPIPGTAHISEEDMVRPAREGMESILEACLKFKVKKLIVTSSMINMIGNVWKRDTGCHHYTEQDYAPYEGSDSYTKSKLAQEAVIRFYLEQEKWNAIRNDLEIVTLHPSTVFGPTLIKEQSGTIEGVVKIMRRSVPGLPNMFLPSVDVRDVAEAHIRALVTPGLHGQRIIINKDSYQFIDDMAMTLYNEFRPHGYRPTTLNIGYWLLYLYSFFDSQAEIVLPMMNIQLTVDNSLSRQLLGMTYDRYTFTQTIVDMGYSLIKMGLVEDRLPKK